MTAKLEIADGACVETTQPAVEIAELRPEKDATYETQERIADPAMERGHGSPLYAAFEPVSHNKVVSFSQLNILVQIVIASSNKFMFFVFIL